MFPSLRRRLFPFFKGISTAALVAGVLLSCGGPPSWSDEEARAIDALREIAAAQVMFQKACFLDANYDGVGDYGTFGMLADPAGDRRIPPLADPLYTTNRVGKYELYLRLVEGEGESSPPYWECRAITEDRGLHCFYVDNTGVVRYADRSENATASSPSVDGPSTDA